MKAIEAWCVCKGILFYKKMAQLRNVAEIPACAARKQPCDFACRAGMIQWDGCHGFAGHALAPGLGGWREPFGLTSWRLAGILPRRIIHMDDASTVCGQRIGAVLKPGV
jgi:hypothetical protein